LAGHTLKATTESDEGGSVTEKEPPVSDEVWQTVQAAPAVRKARVRAGRARLAKGDWPSASQVADALLDGWFLRLAVHS
jgi:hypothetical protein